MGGGKQVNVVLDMELYMALEAHAGHGRLTLSQAIRDLLRHALAVVPSSRDAGWREGYIAARAMVQKAVVDAIAAVPPNFPGE